MGCGIVALGSGCKQTPPPARAANKSAAAASHGALLACIFGELSVVVRRGRGRSASRYTVRPLPFSRPPPPVADSGTVQVRTCGPRCAAAARRALYAGSAEAGFLAVRETAAARRAAARCARRRAARRAAPPACRGGLPAAPGLPQASAGMLLAAFLLRLPPRAPACRRQLRRGGVLGLSERGRSARRFRAASATGGPRESLGGL